MRSLRCLHRWRRFSEYEIWADDLYELLRQNDALPAFIGGSSSGLPLSVLFALRHPEACRGLLLWRVTGGRFACERLAINYYRNISRRRRRAACSAVCELEHFKERCEANPSNLGYLVRLDPKRFIDVMTRWSKSFDESVDLPIIGASEADLKSIKVPTVVIPGNDRTHGTETGSSAAQPHPEMPSCATFGRRIDDSDLGPAEDWEPKNAEMTGYFVAMMKRASDG